MSANFCLQIFVFLCNVTGCESDHWQEASIHVMHTYLLTDCMLLFADAPPMELVDKSWWGWLTEFLLLGLPLTGLCLVFSRARELVPSQSSAAGTQSCAGCPKTPAPAGMYAFSTVL